MRRTQTVAVYLAVVVGLWVMPAALTRGAERRVIGYFAGWSGGDASQLPGELLTHVNYAFGLIKDGRIAIDGNAEAFEKHAAQLRELKRKYPQIRTLISVGGWGGSSPFSDMAFTEAGRKTFAESCAAFVNKHGFDGVDI